MDSLVTPLLSIFITGILTFFVIGGMTRSAGNLLTKGILWLHDSLGIAGGAIFGFLYAPLTMTGLVVETIFLIEVRFSTLKRTYN